MVDEKKIDRELASILEANGYREVRYIPGQGVCALQSFIYTVGLVTGLDEVGYEGRYCYPVEQSIDAVLAINSWDGKDEPSGNWIKYKGKRREYGNPNYKE